MTCPQHKTTCAFPNPDDTICPYCHAPWSKITAPDRIVTGRTGTSKAGKRITVEEITYTGGYGETGSQHIWAHVLANDPAARAEYAAANRARRAA